MSKNYFLATVRQATFRAPRRTSTAGNAKIPKWPHKNAKRYADAGFYFDPTPGHDDNVTCFLCSKSLDGWEPGDNPVSEHYRHSPDCGWAITAEIQESQGQDFTCNPHSDQFALGRLQTFGEGMWPHPDTGNLSVMNMAGAGFHYAPTKGEIDNCICPFCGISLANFEPEDVPRDEHYRRKPQCYFFETESLKPAKRAPRTSTVPKKPATRRASRANSAVPPEPPVERGRSLRDSVDSMDDEETKPARGKRAGSVKPKAAAAKKGGRKKAVPEYATSTNSVSDVDEAPKRGRKRSSSIMSKEPVIMFDGGIDTESGSDEEIVVQPKKRATRASIAKQPVLDIIADPPKRQRTTRASIARQPAPGNETSLTDAEDSVEVKPKKNHRVVSKPTKTPAKNRIYAAPSDDFNDALDHEHPFTDDEDNAAHQKPFVRSTKKVTRSRTSLAVEQSMRNAPRDILIPAAVRGKSKAGSRSGSAAPTKTPMKSFFRDGGLDYSMPISVPRHLNQDVEILDQNDDTPAESEPEPSPPPVPRKGRTKSKKIAGTDDEDPKPTKRTKVSKKKGTVRSRSNTVDSQANPIEPAVPTPVKVEEYEEEVAITVFPKPEPKQAEKPKRVNTKQQPQQPQRESMASPVSTIPDAASTVPDEHPYQRYQTQEEHVPEVPMEEVVVEEELSESGSVVRHVVEVRESFGAGTLFVEGDPDATEDEEHATEPEPEPELETEPEPSPPPPQQSVRKSARKASPQKVTPQMDSPRKASPRKASPQKHLRHSTPSEYERESDAKEHATSLTHSSPFVEHTAPRSESPEVHEMEIDHPSDERELPAAEEEEEEPEVVVASSLHREPTNSPDPVEQPRAPLSPVRRQMMVPLQSTPKAKPSRTVQTSHPWNPIDLDVVFASHPGAEVDEAGLTAAERDMTVEEWVKWNAANAERRLNERAERMIVVFEEKGRGARACIEGIPTV